MLNIVTVILCSLLTFACGSDGVFYPSANGRQGLATKLHCEVEETQYFQYSSASKFWGSMGGDFEITADVALHCLGDDKGGKFESEALKYLVEISNLKIKSTEEKKDEEQQKKAKESGKEDDEGERDTEYLRQSYSMPFQFVQLADGSIPEIRFAENETQDGRIRNFKRHIVDAFATQLDTQQAREHVIEKTVTGEHKSNYKITVNKGKSLQQDEEPTVIVQKLVTDEDILQFAPSEAVNDKDDMQITVQQKQIFKKGRLLSSSGTGSFALLPDNEVVRKRGKREDKEDVTSKFQAQSSFDLRLNRRRRRSAKESARVEMHENIAFVAASRFAEKEEDPKHLEAQNMQRASSGMEKLFKELLQSQGKEYEEKMQTIYEMVHREVNLKLNNEPQSVSSVIRNELNPASMKKLCNDNFEMCIDCLQLLAVAGGPKAEEVFLSFFRKDTYLNPLQLRIAAGFLADLSSPSTSFLDSLVQLISEKRFDQEVLGSVSLGTGSLGSKAESQTKDKIAKMFTDLLNEQKRKCDGDTFLLDILEAVGNLGYSKMVPVVLEVSEKCQENVIQVACAHALRRNSDLSSVQQWMQSKTTDSDCEVIKAIVGSLLDKIQEQKMSADATNWPRKGFNEVDENLKQLLAKGRCSATDTILYFSRKKDDVAKRIAKKYHHAEAKSANLDSMDQFASGPYNQNLDLSFGVDKARSNIHADVSGAVNSARKNLGYRVSSDFSVKLSFLGQMKEVASFSFYNSSGRITGFLRIIGQARQELTDKGCLPLYMRYRIIQEIPWYQFNILVVRITLGLHLSGEFGVAMKCPKLGTYQLEPQVRVRVAGEAIGTVLCVRAGANLGANFNYKLQFIITPIPNMCMSAGHGFDPMNIGFEAFFQWWNWWRWNWGPRRSWQPHFLTWNIGQGYLRPWFTDKCMRNPQLAPAAKYLY